MSEQTDNSNGVIGQRSGRIEGLNAFVIPHGDVANENRAERVQSKHDARGQPGQVVRLNNEPGSQSTQQQSPKERSLHNER